VTSTQPPHAGSLVSALIIRAAGSRWAIPARDAVETMRALPIKPVASPFPAMVGLSVVRGLPIPVVDIARLLTGSSDAQAARFVTVRCGARIVALLVEAIEGIRTIAERTGPEERSLARSAAAGAIASLGSLDHEFLGLLSVTRLFADPPP